ncbi:MAG: DUF362 domain-containing protein [Candidatus Lernaella stagnicola]|nr:DUF362 domain-containing protein [Candidatus Lernaella stagnicola]
MDDRRFSERVSERLARKRSYRVLLRRCDRADPDRVRAILDESLAELGLAPKGRLLIKPNVVTANRRYIHHSYTEPELVRQAVLWARAGGATHVTVGESGGYGIPSRLFMREAGYLNLARDGAKVVDFNTEGYAVEALRRGVHHRTMQVAASLHDADFLLWMPKLKYHICCTITAAIKLNVGILRHRERMLYHDDRLDEKIVDLLEVGYPDAVVLDAIEIGTGYESAPSPIHFGAILVADDPVAADAVACRLLGYEPEQCRHLMLAHERGYGPESFDDIRVEGDVSLAELQAVTAGHESEYQDIHKLRSPIRFYTGNEPTRDRFCHGGCLAAVKGCLGTIDKRRPGSVARAREGAIVTGVYNGDVDAGRGVALLVGSCTRVNGKITAGKVRRVGGCPIGTKRLFMKLPRYFDLPNPMFDVRDSFLFVLFAIDKFFRKVLATISPRTSS